MRPNISDEIAEDVDTVISDISAVDPEYIGFERKLEVLLANLGEIEAETSSARGTTTAGDVRKKYA